MSQARPSYREYVAGLHGDAGPLQLLCRPLAAGSLVELWRFLLLGLEVELTRATGLSWAGWPAWSRVLVNLLALGSAGAAAAAVVVALG